MAARAAIALLLLWLGASPALAQQKRVLVLYSTSPQSFMSLAGAEQLPTLLTAAVPGGVDYYAEYFDRGRFPDAAFETSFAGYLRAKYNDRPFDVVVSIQETASRFVTAYRDELFPGAPHIFMATTPAPQPPNATGIIAEYDLKSTIDLAIALQPDINRVYIVSGAGTTDRAFETMIRRQLAAQPPPLEVVYLTGLRQQELERRLASLPDRSIVYYLTVYEDGQGNLLRPLEYSDRIAAIARVPTYGWIDSMLGRGAVGGSVVSRRLLMREIADVAARVLKGEAADRIPVRTADVHVRQVDWRQLQRWNIRTVPAQTEVLFREFTFWERYSGYVIAAVTIMAAQTALMIGLLIHRRRRQAAEEELRRSEQHLQATYERIRALGGRLLKAQEHERAHVARELHDDISQQMALLQIDLNMLAQSVAPDAEDLAGEVLERTRSISRGVHDLSHRLHPARLRLLGLVPTVQGLAQEMSRSGVTIQVEAHDVPAMLPPDTAVAIFRVIQEGLQNALKYSGATEIVVRLRWQVDRLLLSIADNGVGFDVQAAWGSGLGLLSMRERVEAVGGTIEVRSRPGGQTLIHASVPVESAEDDQAGLLRA